MLGRFVRKAPTSDANDEVAGPTLASKAQPDEESKVSHEQDEKAKYEEIVSKKRGIRRLEISQHED